MVRYLKKQIASQLDADGIFNPSNKLIGIRKGQEWNDELDTLIHEYLHFLQNKYPTKLLKLTDKDDLRKSEQAKVTRKICRLIVKKQYIKLFK